MRGERKGRKRRDQTNDMCQDRQDYAEVGLSDGLREEKENKESAHETLIDKQCEHRVR